MFKCSKHFDTLLEHHELPHGKQGWVCPKCNEERNDWIKKTFQPPIDERIMTQQSEKPARIFASSAEQRRWEMSRASRKAGHTAGPWTVEACTTGLFVMPMPDSNRPNSFLGICQVYEWPGERLVTQVQANARLIAAAPDLLDNEQKNLATLEWTRSRLIEWGKSTSEIDTAIDQTRAAIAKAN